MYLLFLGPFSEGGDFSDSGISGVEKFLKRLWEKAQRVKDFKDVKVSNEIKTSLHQTIKKVEEDMDVLKYNTAIASLMEYMNDLEDFGEYPEELVEPLVKMVAPICPHIAEEIYREVWENGESIFESDWPQYEDEFLTQDSFTLVVQINGAVRGQMEAEKGIKKEEAKKLALKDDNVQRHLEGEEIKKVIYVDDKLINFVT
jgi:leucyl-tRNA synthetase